MPDGSALSAPAAVREHTAEQGEERPMIIRDQVLMVMSGLGFQVSELEDGATLQDLGIDSTELVEIIVALEKNFSISIDPETQGAVTSLGDLVAQVNNLLSTSAAARG
jgi:acyl carrier protein